MPEKESDNCSSDERQARSVALEKAYVHDVYDQIAPHFTDNRYRAWPRVKQFLMDLEPGSLVADIGCGNGKYLDINNQIYKIGLDHCALLTHIARRRRYEVLVCDNLQLPFRDESFDAALSVAVVHHFATTERRVQALRELARILRIGGRVMITVWAMEQRHRKFESQDVLVPWHRPEKSSSDDRGSSAERDVTSTTTSDDDILIYQAYNQTSDSDMNGSCGRQTPDSRMAARRRQLFQETRGCHRGRSFDIASNQNSNEMAGPGETCYSFVKRALQKLSNPGGSYMRRQSYFYRKCRASWFSDSLESDTGEEGHIELRHLEEDPPEERRTQPPQQQSSGYSFKSLTDLFSIIPNILRSRKPEVKEENRGKRVSTASDPREYARKPGPSLNGIVRSRSTACCMFQYENYQNDDLANKAPNSLTSSDIANGNCIVERQLSQQTAIESPSEEEPSEKAEQSSRQEESKPVLDSTTSGRQLLETLFNREEEEAEEGRLVSYWSMPELRSISTETSEEQSDSKVEDENVSAADGGSSSSRKSSREDDSAFIGADKGVDEDDKMKAGSLRNGFVKRSLSIDIAVPKHCPTEQRQYSSSADQPGNQMAPCPSPRWYSLKSETSIESDAVSVVQWKGQSLQSDTSVDSDESIVSVIYRSPSEVEALARRARRGSRSLQASPLTIAPSRGGSVEATSDAGDFSNKTLAKYLDAECTEVREIIGDFRSLDLRSKLQQGMLKSRRSRSTSVDLDFRSESKVLGSKDLRRSSLPCPMYVRKSLEIEEEEEDEDSKNDSTEVFVTKSDDDSSKSTFRRLCRSEPIDLSEDDMGNITDDAENENEEQEETTDCISNKELLKQKIEDFMEEETKLEHPTSVKLKNEENNNCRKPVGILKYCYRASSLEERSPKRIRLPRRSLSDASDPLPPIQEIINSPRVRLCLEERPRGGGSIPRLNPTLTWQFSPNVPDIMRQDDKELSNSEEDIDLLQPDQMTSGLSPSSEEKDSSARRSFRQSSEEFDTSSMQLSRQSSTTSEDYSDFHRHYVVDKNPVEMMREDSSEPSLPLQEAMNRSDSSDRKSSYIRESSEEHNQEESFDHDVSSVTASVGSKDTEDDIHRQQTKRSRSTDGSDVDLMHTSATSIPEHSFGKLEILPVPDDPCMESYDVNEWTARNCTDHDHLSRNTSLSLSTSQESLVGNESGGLMTYHRYYHVFREGELDHLIETQVENLHIISSYYDHANWCVVAEKVRVWTI